MIANLTLKQQQEAVKQAMSKWLRECIDNTLQTSVADFEGIRFLKDIDLVARYDKSVMIIDRICVTGVRLQFIDHDSTVHTSEEFKGPDEVLLEYVSITLQSQLDQNRNYGLKLLMDGDSVLVSNSVSEFDEYSLNCAHSFQIK